MFAAPNDDHLTKKEKRHKVFYERLESLSRDFLDNKEKIYNDKINQIKQELRDILDGTHEEYEEQVHILEQEHYQLECADKLFQIEKDTCLQEFAQEKQVPISSQFYPLTNNSPLQQGLREKILQTLEEKKRKLHISVDAQKSFTTRKTPEPSRRSKPRNARNQATLPTMLLKEPELSEDLAQIGRLKKKSTTCIMRTFREEDEDKRRDAEAVQNQL
ncbi:hypothetical protein BC829DRAFT_392964 [Chytridium lagenaria]|nr:hypothetical protein BC829DRAFT_392964 [Chytridium lagenaria]